MYFMTFSSLKHPIKISLSTYYILYLYTLTFITNVVFISAVKLMTGTEVSHTN